MNALSQTTPQIVPRYEVEKLSGTVKKMVYRSRGMKKVNGKDRHQGFDKVEIEEDAGYLVYFPRGHCVRMSHAELIRQGFDKSPTFTDMNMLVTDEQVQQMMGNVVSLKQRAQHVLHGSQMPGFGSGG